MATPNYSKSEWASLSIQERIRAMNKVAGDDESLQQSIPSVESENEEHERPELPRRSSVIDMWRKREATSPTHQAAKPKKEKPPRSSPVSVPWPDEEDKKPQQLHPPRIQPQKEAPSWKAQIKSSSRSVVEEKEADLTILPSTSEDHNEEVTAASHSKSVMDLWTRRTLTIPDSPVTVATEPDEPQVVETPKRSSVLDIWTKRTSGETPKRSFGATPKRAAPKVQVQPSSEKKLAPRCEEEEKEADLTILPSKSEDHDEDVAAASHSKSVTDLWTKRTLTIPDSPVIVESVLDEPQVVETAKRSSVLDIWATRTSGETPKRSLGATPKRAAPKVQPSSEKKMEPPLPTWNKRKVSTKTEDAKKEEQTDLVVLQEDEEESPKASSVVNRYNPAGVVPQLRKVPPRPVVVKNVASEDPIESSKGSKQSNVTNRWKPQGFDVSAQLRNVSKKSPSPVTTEPTVEDDEYTAESTVEETKTSSVVSRWKPQGSGESPQLRKVPVKAPFPVVAGPSVEDGENTGTPIEELIRSSIVNRWRPKGADASPQLRKVPMKVPTAIVTEPSAEYADGDKEAAAEEPKPSSVMNRWNPQRTEARPQLRTVPAKVTPSTVTEPSEKDADGDKETVAVEPQQSSVVNRWNPQGADFSPQVRLRKVKTKVGARQPSADDEAGSTTEDLKTPSVVKRWNPQGAIASPQLRKMIDRVATPVGTEPTTAETADDEKEISAAEDPQRSIVVNRWKPAGTEAKPRPSQLRKIPIKVPPPIVTDLSAGEHADRIDESVAEESKTSSLAYRWNPQGNEASGSAEFPTKAKKQQKRLSVLDRYNPQGSGKSPRAELHKVPLQEPSPSVPQIAPDRTEERSEQSEPFKANCIVTFPTLRKAKPIVADEETSTEALESSQPPTPKSNLLDRYLPRGISQRDQKRGTPNGASQRKLSGNEISPVVSRKEALNVTMTTSVTEENSEKTSGSASVIDRYKPATAEKQLSAEQSSVPTPQAKDDAPIGTAPSASNEDALKENSESAADAWEATELPHIEAAYSLPFDESPSTKLFASIEMNNSNSTDQGVKTEGGKVEGITDDFPPLPDKNANEGTEGVSEIEETEGVCKVEETKGVREVEETGPSGNGDAGREVCELNRESEDKISAAQPESKPEEPRPAVTAQRSKAIELFASRRKYQHSVKVLVSDVGSKKIVEAPVPKPATALNKKPLDSSSLMERKSKAVNKEKFQSGSSAFTSKSESATAESTAPKNPASSSLGMHWKRSRRPKTMKEFLKQHRLKKSPALYSSSETATSRSSASVGSVEYSNKLTSRGRTDENVNTVDDCVDALEAPTSGTAPDRIEAARVSSPASEDVSVVESSQESQSNTGPSPTSFSQLDAPAVETDTVLPLPGETEEYAQEDEPGSIVSNASTKSAGKHQHNFPSPFSSPRTRSLQERRKGRLKQNTPKSRPTLTPKKDEGARFFRDEPAPVESSSHYPRLKPVQAKAKAIDDRASTFRDDHAPEANSQSYPKLKPVQERAKAINERSSATFQSKSTGSWITDKNMQLTTAQGDKSANAFTSQWSQKYTRTQENPNALTPAATSDAGTSDTVSFFSAASSTFSGISAEGSMMSPSSSLSNRASRALVHKRRNKLSKTEEKLAAKDFSRRVVGNTINEHSRSGAEEEDDDDVSDNANDHVDKKGSAEESFFGDAPEIDVSRGPGLSGRYNTSSRFMDSMQNIAKGVVTSNMSFGSDTTEGSSQIRSVSSTSGSEAWMSGRTTSKSASSLNRVPSDSTDVSYHSESVMTGQSGKGGEVVTEYFVSESSSNLEALKSAYEAVSLHQLALDLTDEVSVATKVNLRKIASDLNEGMSTASSSLRNGFNNLNNSGASVSSNKSPRKLKVPTTSNNARGVDEEVAIEVEYMEDSDEEEIDSPSRKKVEGNASSEEHVAAPAGEPSQESSPSDRRRAYV